MQWVRIGSGLTAMAMLVWLLWPPSSWSPDPEPLIAFLIAICVWLWRELVDAHGSNPKELPDPHPHDVALAKKIRETFGEKTRDFLRHHDLGGSFRAELADPTFSVADNWIGLEYQFEDSRLNDAMSKLINVTREFGQKLAIESGPAGGGRLLSVPTAKELAEDTFSDSTSRTVADLNAMATKVLETYEELDRLMRAKLPSAYEMD